MIQISNQQYINRNSNFKKVNFKANLPIMHGIESGTRIAAENPNIACCLNYFARQYEQNKIINFRRLYGANIPNLQIVNNIGVRGETLSSPKNDKFLPLVKKCGIDTIIDLRGEDYTPKYKLKCDKYGLNYIHFPIDKNRIPAREILDKLPDFFKILERGKFYIACAQGLHRTDIALSLNYLFNPKQKIPPFLVGHTYDHVVNMENINRRVNSIYKEMTPEDKAKLGWTEKYEKEFLRKKSVLRTYSEVYETPRTLY